MLSVNLVKVALAIYREAGTPEVGRRCRKMLLSGDLAGLVSMEVDPRNYSDAAVFRKDYQCVSFLRKLQVDIPTIDRRGVAHAAFWASERQCWDTNSRFSRFITGGSISSSESKALSVLDRAREWVRRVLGPLPKELELCRFGPGATVEVRGPAATVLDKLRSQFYVTPAARDLLPLAYRTRVLGAPGRQSDPTTVRGNVYQTVPKDAKKDRGICIEPGLNVWFQLGVGSVIRDKLKRRASINLDTAQPIHNQWAQQASHDGLKATIDLSNASDTVSRKLVEWLMPPDWFCLLNSLRSPITHLSETAARASGLSPRRGGEVPVFLEKFSSMGNGYTFELETLIFSSICYALGCGESGVDYRVYGDDIIVGSEHALGVIAALRFCGFTPNVRKTFVTGWFKESCGGDFFKGVEVTPMKQEVDPRHPAEWISLANGLRRVAFGRRGVGFCYTPLHAAWLAALEALPVNIRRLRGPYDLGDLVIHDYEYPVDYTRGYGRIKVLKPVIPRLPLVHWEDRIVLAFLTYVSKPKQFDLRTTTRQAMSLQWPDDVAPQKTLGVAPRGMPENYRVGYVTHE